MTCVIPAAGASRRMGSWKLLLPAGCPGGEAGVPVAGRAGGPAAGQAVLVDKSVGAALAAGCTVLLVTGFRAAELEARFAGWPGVGCVRHPDWERGMLGSIQAGLRALAGGPCLVLPADLPGLRPASVRAVMDTAAGRAAAGLPDLPLVPWCRGRRGHPVYLPAGLAPAILALPPQAALRGWLEAAGALALELDDPGIAADIDAPADYADWLRSQAGQG